MYLIIRSRGETGNHRDGDGKKFLENDEHTPIALAIYSASCRHMASAFLKIVSFARLFMLPDIIQASNSHPVTYTANA